MEQAQNPSTQQNNGVPLTQSAAMIVNSMRKFTTRWPPLDKLLKGGIAHGHILEISGPPGCPKESIAIDIAVSVLQAGERVIFVGTLEHEHLWLTECKQLFFLFFFYRLPKYDFCMWDSQSYHLWGFIKKKNPSPTN